MQKQEKKRARNERLAAKFGLSAMFADPAAYDAEVAASDARLDVLAAAEYADADAGSGTMGSTGGAADNDDGDNDDEEARRRAVSVSAAVWDVPGKDGEDEDVV